MGGVISADQGGGVAGQGLESRDHPAQGRRCPSPQVLQVLFHTAAFCNSASSLPVQVSPYPSPRPPPLPKLPCVWQLGPAAMWILSLPSSPRFSA